MRPFPCRFQSIHDAVSRPAGPERGLRLAIRSPLFPIARSHNRAALDLHAGALPFAGVDLWNAYELSWLDAKGKPRVAMATFSVPADSPNIIESKSFKLYLNSFNQTRLVNSAAARPAGARPAAGAPVAWTSSCRSVSANCAWASWTASI